MNLCTFIVLCKDLIICAGSIIHRIFNCQDIRTWEDWLSLYHWLYHCFVLLIYRFVDCLNLRRYVNYFFCRFKVSYTLRLLYYLLFRDLNFNRIDILSDAKWLISIWHLSFSLAGSYSYIQFRCSDRDETGFLITHSYLIGSWVSLQMTVYLTAAFIFIWTSWTKNCLFFPFFSERILRTSFRPTYKTITRKISLIWAPAKNQFPLFQFWNEIRAFLFQ